MGSLLVKSFAHCPDNSLGAAGTKTLAKLKASYKRLNFNVSLNT